MIRILIAEDNAINRELLRELLEARGYAVEEASDGQAALRMMEHSAPDILLLDIGMPVLDGYAVVRKVRENPRLVHLPVLAVTAYAMQGDREKILSSGFDGYLAKPVNAGLLIEEVKRLLARADRRDVPTRQTSGSDGAKKARSAGASGPGE
jgi:CheY-like chemotaxis protein